MRNLPDLIEVVQTNCHIADAAYAREMTMCTYLLEMREYFRWEHELPLTQHPPKDEIGRWLMERERLWESLNAGAFAPLPVEGQEIPPFESELVNRCLLPQGMVYGAGIGRFHKPHFFLGELVRREEREGITILVSGCEYARDLTTLPASFQNGIIYLRQDALKRALWEKIELWQNKSAEGPLKSALQCYDYARNPEAALQRMSEQEGEAVILHELGEALAQRQLGADWQAMLGGFSHRHSEVAARAMRDHLADCLSTLPRLLETQAWGSLHFYFAEFDGMRKSLFPRLYSAYLAWSNEGDLGALEQAVEAGREHWQDVTQTLVEQHRQTPDEVEKRLLEKIRQTPTPLAL